MKKVLSLVLVIAMVLSSFSFALAAPKFEDIADTDYEKAINTLAALKVIDGYDDGTFKPGKTITRAEMAKLMVQLLGYGDLVAGSKSNFSDTQGHWADPWIALAAGRGLVIGTGDGKFTPDRIVTYDEAITMVIRGLGYTDTCNELKGTWPTNYKVKAAELKLTKDVKLAAAGADRGGVAQLMFNALESALVSVDTDGNVTRLFDTVTTVENNKSRTEQVIRPLLSRLATKQNITIATTHLDEDSKNYLGNIVDLGPYMYQNIDAYVNDDDEVVYVAKVHSDILVGEFRKTTDANGDAKTDGKVNVRIDGKNKAYDLKETKIPVYYNGVEIKLTEAEMEKGSADVINMHKAAATFVLDVNDEITAIIADKYTGAVRVSNEYNGRKTFEGIALPLNDDDKVDYKKLTVKGEVDSLEDVEVDDVLVLFAGAGEKTTTSKTEKLVIQVVRDTVEGKITKTNSDGQFYINNKFYSASEFKQYTFLVGEEGTYFLDQKGQLVDFEETDKDEPKDYAVITKVRNGSYDIDAQRIALDADMTIVNAKGEEVTYKFDDKAKVKVETTESYVFNERGNSQTTVTETKHLKVNTLLSKFDVIKYSVNSKGKISNITIVKDNPVANPIGDKDITGKSYVFASNVVVFNRDDNDVEVVNADDLGDSVFIIAQVKNKNGEIEMFFVEGLGASDTYAFIVDHGTALNKDDETVQSLIAYVDGKEVFYLADKKGVVGKEYIDTATIVSLTLDGSVVTDVTSHSALKTGNITKVKGDRFELGGQWWTLAEDAAVYILDGGEFDSVGEKSSVYYDAKVAVYAFDDDNVEDKIAEIVFIFE